MILIFLLQLLLFVQIENFIQVFYRPTQQLFRVLLPPVTKSPTQA